MAIFSPIYELAGKKVGVFTSCSKIYLICQAYYHLAETTGPSEYEIHFIERTPGEDDTDGINDAQEETCIRFQLEEGLFLSYFPRKKKMVACYPAETFVDPSSQDSHPCTLVYENTYNNEKLPFNSSGVLNAVHWFLENLNIFRLHAAFTRYNGTDILLPGRGAVGKTTSALNIAFNGGQIFADDQIYLTRTIDNQDEVAVYPVPKKIAVTPQTIDFFSEALKSKKKLMIPYMQKHHFDIRSIFQRPDKIMGIPGVVIFPHIISEDFADRRDLGED